MVLEAASADRRGRGTGRRPALTAGLYEPHRAKAEDTAATIRSVGQRARRFAFFSSCLSDRVKCLSVHTLVELSKGLTASVEVLPVLVEQHAWAPQTGWLVDT